MCKAVCILLFLFLGGNIMAQNIRKAAVAGKFYACDREILLKDVKRCYGEAAILAPLSKAEQDSDSAVQAVIVPHAGYVFSGAVAASAFIRIPTSRKPARIFLIGPSHHVAFEGASVATVFDAYETPLGNVKVDRETCDKLFAADSVFTYKPSAHDREHCLEVQLPLLQYRFKDDMPPIVPIIIGTEDMSLLKRMAEVLKSYLTPDNLFVISSDFSHYPSYNDALTVDGNTAKGLANGRIDEFVHVLSDNRQLHIPNLYTSACGEAAIAVLLLMAQDKEHGTVSLKPGLKMQHIAYLNSGDSPYGGKDEVVGYHSYILELSGPFNLSPSPSPSGRGDAKSSNPQDIKTEPVNKIDTTEMAFPLHEGEGLGERSTSLEPLLDVAWNAISPANLHKEVKPTKIFEKKLGVFVTLTKNGRLRGCIGHFGEDVPVGELTAEMAHAAAFEDPRFPPLDPSELKDISIEISILTPLKRIHSIDEFHYGKDGIYMRKGFRSGTFLPQVADEVNWTKEEFLGHCAQDKAGIGWDGWKTAELYTYRVIRLTH